MRTEIRTPTHNYGWFQCSASENIERYINSLLLAIELPLAEQAANRPTALHLYTAPRTIELLSGRRNDGTVWTCSVGGFSPQITGSGVKSWESNEHLYTMQKCSYQLKEFDFYFQTILCGCDKKRTRVGVCLPAEFIPAFQQFCDSPSEERPLARKNFLRQLFSYVAAELPLHPRLTEVTGYRQ